MANVSLVFSFVKVGTIVVHFRLCILLSEILYKLFENYFQDRRTLQLFIRNPSALTDSHIRPWTLCYFDDRCPLGPAYLVSEEAVVSFSILVLCILFQNMQEYWAILPSQMSGYLYCVY